MGWDAHVVTKTAKGMSAARASYPATHTHICGYMYTHTHTPLPEQNFRVPEGENWGKGGWSKAGKLDQWTPHSRGEGRSGKQGRRRSKRGIWKWLGFWEGESKYQGLTWCSVSKLTVVLWEANTLKFGVMEVGEANPQSRLCLVRLNLIRFRTVC